MFKKEQHQQIQRKIHLMPKKFKKRVQKFVYWQKKYTNLAKSVHQCGHFAKNKAIQIISKTNSNIPWNKVTNQMNTNLPLLSVTNHFL